MNKRKLLAKARNNPRNVRFTDLVSLAEAFGFVLDRTKGNHHVFKHPSVPVLLNLQSDRNGKAEDYQVRPFFSLIDRYGLTLEDGQ